MTGLVLELQRDCLNREVPVSDILRKAHVVAKKLNQVEIQEWIRYELNGYPDDDIVPEYREIRGTPMAMDVYRGNWLPIIINNSEIETLISERKITESVTSLANLFITSSEPDLVLDYSSNKREIICKIIKYNTDVKLFIHPNEVYKIIEVVRNKLLDWCLDLESKNILGEGMSFSEQEKNTAKAISYNITNHIGSMHNSQIQQDSANSSQSITISTSEIKPLIAELKNKLEQNPLKQEQKAEVLAEIQTLEIQAKSPKPKSIIIQESTKTLRTLLEGTSAGIIANKIWEILQKSF